MQWTGGLTQTPQVALDFRFSQNPQGDLVLDIDYAEQAIDAATVADILAAIERAIAGIASSIICRPVVPSALTTSTVASIAAAAAIVVITEQ